MQNRSCAAEFGNRASLGLCDRYIGGVQAVFQAHVLRIEQDESGGGRHKDTDQPEEGAVKDVRHLTPLRRLIRVVVMMTMMVVVPVFSAFHRFGVDAGAPGQPAVRRLHFSPAPAPAAISR